MRTDYVNLNYFTTLRDQLRAKYPESEQCYLRNITQPTCSLPNEIILSLSYVRDGSIKRYELRHSNNVTPGTFKMSIISDPTNYDNRGYFAEYTKPFVIILPSNLSKLSIESVLEGCRMADEHNANLAKWFEQMLNTMLTVGIEQFFEEDVADIFTYFKSQIRNIERSIVLALFEHGPITILKYTNDNKTWCLNEKGDALITALSYAANTDTFANWKRAYLSAKKENH